MPTPVQSLITGEAYDPVITVSANGETITEAQLINTAVALGNRIEFIRKLSAEANAEPEKFFTLREDWLNAVYTAADDKIYGDLIWQSDPLLGTPVVSHDPGSTKNQGSLIISLPAGATADQLDVALGSMTAATMSFALFEQITFVFNAIHNAGNPAPKFEMGLCQNVANMPSGAGGTDSLRVRFCPADSANWLVNLRKASTPTEVDSGVPFVSGEFIVVQFQRNAALGIDVKINGALITTISAANQPAGNGTLGFCAFKTGADTFATSMKVDLITARQPITTRAGT